MMLDAFVRWLSATPLCAFLGAHDWITPSVQTVHILAIATVMGAILLTDLKVLGLVGRDEPMTRFSMRYLPWMAGALVVLLVSGSLLIIGEPARSLQNPVFGLKMGLLLAALMLTAALHWPVRTDGGFWDRAGRRGLGVGLAGASLLVWSAIVLAGRWIAYAQ